MQAAESEIAYNNHCAVRGILCATSCVVYGSYTRKKTSTEAFFFWGEVWEVLRKLCIDGRGRSGLDISKQRG